MSIIKFNQTQNLLNHIIRRSCADKLIFQTSEKEYLQIECTKKLETLKITDRILKDTVGQMEILRNEKVNR